MCGHVGNKNLLITMLCIYLCLVLCSCMAVVDWTYSKLPYGYEIWHVNSECIRVGKREDQSLSDPIDRYVVEFCYNSRYICIKAIDFELVEKYSPDFIIDDYDLSLEYFIIDAETDAVYGGYNYSDFETEISSLDINDLCEWIATVPTPEGAHYG